MSTGIYYQSSEMLAYILYTSLILIAIVISKLLKCHSKAKCRAPAQSWALCQIRGGLSRG